MQTVDNGADLFRGQARFVAPRTLEVDLRDGGKKTISGERVLVDVGTHAAIPAIPGLTEAKPMTHVEALDLARLPEHLIVRLHQGQRILAHDQRECVGDGRMRGQSAIHSRIRR